MVVNLGFVVLASRLQCGLSPGAPCQPIDEKLRYDGLKTDLDVSHSDQYKS